MNNPIKDIEDRKANEDTGRVIVQIFAGARDEAKTWSEAFWATVAFLTAMFKQHEEDKNEEDDNEV